MKRLIFVLSVILVVLLIVWLVGRRYGQSNFVQSEYQASVRDEKITIYDIDELEKQCRKRWQQIYHTPEM